MIGELIGGALAGGLQAGADIADQAWKEAQEAKKQAAEMGLFKYKIDAQVEGQKEIARMRGDVQLEVQEAKGNDALELELERRESRLQLQDKRNAGDLDEVKERNKRPVGGGGSGRQTSPGYGASAIATELKDLRKMLENTYDPEEKKRIQSRIDKQEKAFDKLYENPQPSTGPATGAGVRKLPPIDSVNPKDGVIDFRNYTPKKPTQGK